MIIKIQNYKNTKELLDLLNKRKNNSDNNLIIMEKVFSSFIFQVLNYSNIETEYNKENNSMNLINEVTIFVSKDETIKSIKEKLNIDLYNNTFEYIDKIKNLKNETIGYIAFELYNNEEGRDIIFEWGNKNIDKLLEELC